MKLWKVIKMEFKMIAANRAFIILTIIGPFLILAVTVLPSYLAMKSSPEEKTVAIAGGDRELVTLIKESALHSGIEIVELPDNPEILKSRLLNEEIDGYVILPGEIKSATTVNYVTSTGADWATIEKLQGIIGSAVTMLKLREAGVPTDRVGEIMTRPRLVPKKLSKSGEERSEDYLTGFFTVLAFTVLLYMTILLYGQSIGRSVVMEKTQKTVEILLSSVRTDELLFGKILGSAFASILQYVFWIGVTVFSIKVFGPMLGLTLNIPLESRLLGYLVLYFLLAFFLYSSIYAALGAASSDEQNLGQLSWPLIIFLVLPMVSISVITSNPDGNFSVFLSLFPLTSPIVMFQRIAIGNPPVSSVLLSIGIILVTTAFTVVLSARIFKVGILLTGKRHTIREILRWLHYR